MLSQDDDEDTIRLGESKTISKCSACTKSFLQFFIFFSVVFSFPVPYIIELTIYFFYIGILYDEKLKR